MDTQTVISRDIIDKFIEVGDKIEKNVPQIDSKKLNKYNSINRISWQGWESSIEGLDDNLLIQLFKGLVYVERELNWIGGSVAAAVWIAMFLAERRNNIENPIPGLRAGVIYRGEEVPDPEEGEGKTKTLHHVWGALRELNDLEILKLQ